jgi:hypothetical protein
MKILLIGWSGKILGEGLLGPISQIARFGDTSDEITGITALCEKILWIVYICNFFQINSFIQLELSK